MILGGDIGGTKTLLALCDDAGKIQRDAIYHCAEFGSLDAVIDRFLPTLPALTGACFGVAGPVVGGVAKITNLPWAIDARALSTKLGAPTAVINDLQATALGTLALPGDAFAVLQPQATPAPTGTIAVLAPGTGLGESMLVHDGTRYVALPTEAGHADFAPGTDEEIELLRFLRGKYGNHVSNERVLSGNGIGDLYDFVRARTSGTEPDWLARQMAAGDRNAVVAETALDRRDAACTHALELFVALLGAEAGNFALRTLATGGVVIGGGIPPKILPALQRGPLLARLNDKGRFSAWTRTLGVRVALEQRAALFGAIHHVVTSKDARS